MEAPHAGRHPVSPHFVGRAEHLGRLNEVLDELSDGTAVNVLITGKAGIGKSRLLRELQVRAHHRGMRTLSGRCLDLSGSLAFVPVVEALRGLLEDHTAVQLADAAGSGASHLARLLPEISDVVDPSTADDRLAMFTAVRSVLRATSRTRPMLFAIEDLQWSDNSTRDLLTFLVNSGDPRTGFVLTCRDTALPDDVARWLTEIERAVRPERVELSALNEQEVAALVEALTGSQPTARERDRLMRLASGNPFFVEELVAAPAGEIPSALADLLRLRLDGLPPNARRFVEVGAVGGDLAIDTRRVATVAEMSQQDLSEVLRTLVDQGWFSVDTEGRYRFRHGLLAEAAVRGLLPEERTALHEAWATTLEEGDGRQPSTLAAIAHHWDAAGAPDRAAKSALDAAEAAETLLAYPEAAQEYERALRLWDHVGAARAHDRISLSRRAARAAHLAGHHQRAVDALIGVVADIDDPAQRSVTLSELGEYQLFAGHRHEALEMTRRALTSIPDDDSPRGLLSALIRATRVNFLADRIGRALDLAERSVRAAESLDDAQLARALSYRARIRAVSGDLDGATGDTNAVSSIASEDPDPSLQLSAHSSRLFVLEHSGRYEEGLRLAYEEVLPLVERLGLDHRYGVPVRSVAAHFAWLLGRWDEAGDMLQAAEDLQPKGHLLKHIQRIRLDLAVARGDFQRATRLLENVDDRSLADIQVPLEFARIRTEMRLWQHQPRTAHDVYGQALDIHVPEGAEHLTAGLVVTALRANADLAEQHPTEIDSMNIRSSSRDLLERLRDSTASRRDEFQAWRPTGEAELARLEHDEEETDAWEAASRAWEALHIPFRTAYCRYRRSESLIHANGPSDEATGLLRDAYQTADRLGALPLLQEIESLARRARIDPQPDQIAADEQAPDDPLTKAGLTEREREVVRLVAQGLTNKEIATSLFITEKTVEGHVSNLLRKLDATNRVQAATRFERMSASGQRP